MNEVALEVQQISKSFFGVPALREISLKIHKGHILGLIGENGAGKSTLMNIIGGVVRHDSGTMLLNGQPYTPNNPAEAYQSGIAFIHQELNLFPNLTIAENIFIKDFPKWRVGPLALIDRNRMRQRTRELLDQVDVNLAPETLVERLAPGERQLVEIAKALHIDADIILFDEPTTSLTARETEKLFELMNRLRGAGKTLIYISHILREVVTLADEIAVLRDGELVGRGSTDQMDIQRMIFLMVGRSIEQLYPARISKPSTQPVLQTKRLSEPGIIKDIDLTMYAGEVLGLFGLMGSGRTELAHILFGIEGFESGELMVQGVVLHNPSPRSSIRNGVAYVTENRRDEGLMMDLAISDNIALVSLPRFAFPPLQVVDDGRLRATVSRTVAALQIRSGAIDQQTAKHLSGGNQQKVVLAKWLMANPSIFILDEPTRGVDIGAKYEIYTIINNLAAQGCGVLFISSELDELMGMCDRILVMNRGEIVSEFERTNFDEEQILRAAFREAKLTP